MISTPQFFSHPLDQNFGSDQSGAMNNLDNTQGQVFQNRIANLENAFQTLAREHDTSRVFQAGLEQRVKQIEARLDAMGSLYRNMENRLRAYDNLAREGLRIAAIERRMDMLERRHQGCIDVPRRQGPLSRGIPPAKSASVHGRGRPAVGHGHVNNGRKRQRDDGGGQSTDQDGNWSFGGKVDLTESVQNEPERVREHRVPLCTTLPPRTISLDLE